MKSRRKFIKTAGMMATGGVLLGQYACSPKKTAEDTADGAESTAAVSQNKKKIGLQLYTLRDKIQESLPNTLEQVASIGYVWMEGYGYENGKILGVSPQEFKQLIEDNGLELPSMHAVTELTSSGGKSAIMDAMRKTAEDVKTTGAQYLIYAYLQESERQSMDDYKRHAENFNEFGQICKDAGLQFGYHNHDFEFIEFNGQIPYFYLLENTDQDLVKFETDLYWITKAGHDPVEIFNKYSGRFPLWHVKDMEPGEEQFFAEVGQGKIDFARIFEQENTAGMKYFFVEQDSSRRDPMESIRMSYNYLQDANFLS
jgi:sugar phosphate isomerase/epimerase